MSNKLAVKWGLIIAILLGSLYLIYPNYKWYSKPLAERETLDTLGERPKRMLNLGLDLRGGSSLLLELEVSKLNAKEPLNEAMARAIEIIRNRIDQYGVAETSITKQGDKWIMVQLPGVSNPQRAEELIGKTAMLEFRIVKNDTTAAQQAIEKLESMDKPFDDNGNLVPEVAQLVPAGYQIMRNKESGYSLVTDTANNKFVSLRQTAVLHKYMFANNLKDGLMFHTSWNAPLEWVTDRDSGVLCKNLVELDGKGQLEGFWNRVYNIGGGAACRETGFETIDSGFRLMGKGAEKFFKPNWNIPRNFHGVWFYDSDELENYLHFRSETNADHWKRMGKKYRYFKLGAMLPSALISKLFIQRLFKNTNAPMYWIKHRKDGRVKAFYGSLQEFEKIGTDWKKFELLCRNENYENLKNIENCKPLLLNHGYDDMKPLDKIDLNDLKQAAAFRGGECLAKDFNLHEKALWKCKEGHTFESTPYTVLKGGYWCPHCCEPKPWRYGKLAKDIPFYAQVYFDTHTKEETDDIYPLNEQEDDFLKNS